MRNRNFYSILKTAGSLVVVATALFMTSCQSNDDSSNDEPPVVDITKSTIAVNNNSAELSKRVTMYSNSEPLSKAKKDDFGLTMPAVPASPKYDLVMDDNYQGWSAQKKDYYLPEGKSLTKDIQFNSNTYYIAGELTITNFWGQGGKIIVMPGGKLNYPSRMPLDGFEILNYGEFNVINGSNLTINTGASVMTSGDLEVDEVYVSGVLYVGGRLSVQKADVLERGVCHVGCVMNVNKTLTIHNEAKLHIEDYLATGDIEMNSKSMLQIKAGGLVRTKGIYMRNPCTVTVSGDDMDYAVLAADEVEIHQNNVKDMFTGWLDIHYKEIDNHSGRELEWLSSIKHNGDTYLPESGCRSSFGEKPEVEVEKAVGLEHIAQVESPADNLSATCIQTVKDKAYVSYHTQGNGYCGYIEVLNVAGEMCSILSQMEHATSDFNHLIVDNNRVIAAGGEAKGAFLGVVNLSGGIFSSSAAELSQVMIEGASASSVIRNGEYLHATSNEGYHTLDAKTFNTEFFVRSAGSSKYVHVNGANMGVLSLTNKNSESSPAVLNVYGATDYSYKTLKQSIPLGEIAPVNGKNVFQLDGNDIYVCLGRNGVKRFTGNTEVASFDIPDDVKGAANGLAVDAKYVYVAYGNSGVYVLDKTDLSVVASYIHAGGKSANYVSVSGDIIYVSYGLSGVQVFRLIEK